MARAPWLFYHLQYKTVFELVQTRVFKIPKRVIWSACTRYLFRKKALKICYDRAFASFLFLLYLFPVLKVHIWLYYPNNPSLPKKKEVLFASMNALYKWWKMHFLSSLKFFSFSRYSNFRLHFLIMKNHFGKEHLDQKD